MRDIAGLIRLTGMFLRRRDLLTLGYSDQAIRGALESRRIFRVRHGWYSAPDAPESAIRAVRVGGRLTAVSALETYGFALPHSPHLHIVVSATASRLRSADDRRRRLNVRDQVRVHWVDSADSSDHLNDPEAASAEASCSRWRVSTSEALLEVLRREPRDIAIACASAVLRSGRWSDDRMDRLFQRAPSQVTPWRKLVSRLDDSHGERFLRLWLIDAAIAFEQQVAVPGIGRFDFRVGPHTFVEVDGAQHDESWVDSPSGSWHKGHNWDTSMAILGNTVLRFTYRQLYTDWPRVLAAIRRSIDDDVAYTKYRMTHPQRHTRPEAVIRAAPQVPTLQVPVAAASHASRKRRTFTTNAPPHRRNAAPSGETPAFSGRRGAGPVGEGAGPVGDRATGAPHWGRRGGAGSSGRR